MTQVVRQAGGFDNRNVQSSARFQFRLMSVPAEANSKAPADLCNLEGVREPIVEELELSTSDDLRYSAQPPKRFGVQDSVSIVLRWTACIFAGRILGQSAIVAARSRCQIQPLFG